MARPSGAVGKHRHRADLVFALHDKDPLEELLAIADDPSLSVERRAQLWLDLMPFLYPKLRSVAVEHSGITFQDFLALPAETLAEISRGCREFVEEQERKPKEPVRKVGELPLPTCFADLKRYR